MCFGARSLKVRKPALTAAILVCAACGCGNTQRDAAHQTWQKVELDLAQLDENGLRGPADGKVSVTFEFCIPDTEECKAAVRAIDPKIQFMPGSRGRIGAGKGECLCIGETGPNYRDVLRRLAELPYVRRIIECHFE